MYLYRCGIPVIVMGETGCGKTCLIKFLCSLQCPAGLKMNTMTLMKVIYSLICVLNVLYISKLRNCKSKKATKYFVKKKKHLQKTLIVFQHEKLCVRLGKINYQVKRGSVQLFDICFDSKL